MVGLMRVVGGALLLATYLRLGLAQSMWVAGGLAVVTAALAVLIAGRAESARWGALALALALVGAGEVRHGMSRSGKLLLGLVVWIAVAQIVHWVVAGEPETARTGVRGGERPRPPVDPPVDPPDPGDER